jgi:hypothetical protein
MLTERDKQVLSALLLKVRLMSLKQLAGGWWGGETVNARRRLKLLTAGGLLQPLTVAARTLPPLDAPVIVWQPDDPVPDFSGVSRQLQSRWRRRAVRPTRAFIATPKAAQLLGGRGNLQLKHPTQATHDLGVAAVWLHLNEHAPAWAEAWRGEDLLAHTRRGETLPDAFIVDEEHEPLWVIEFGGAYDAGRVQEFHEDCQVRQLPYQMW